MDAKEHLFYGFGHVAYALAKADGKVQYQEHNSIHRAVEDAIRDFDYDFSVVDIAFQVLETEYFDVETAYKTGLRSMHLGNDYLTDDHVKVFVQILEKVAASHAPTTELEQNLIDRFKEDVKSV